jgi:hypothetical protein
MSASRVPLHGRSHLTDGSDPIPGLGGGGGIQFDTYPQVGGYLNVEANASGPNGYALEFFDTHDNGIALNGGAVDIGDVYELSGGAKYHLSGSGHRFDLTGAQRFAVCSGYNGSRIVEIIQAGTGDKLGFFAAAPVAQQATPTTLADVIALLQAYGLSA